MQYSMQMFEEVGEKRGRSLAVYIWKIVSFKNYISQSFTTQGRIFTFCKKVKKEDFR